MAWELIGTIKGPQGDKGEQGDPAEVVIDAALDDASTNPVQNKVIKAALDAKAASEHTHDASAIVTGTFGADRLSSDIPVSKFANDAGYQTATQVSASIDAKISSVYRYKGSVANQAALPSSDNVTGDIYNCEDTGMNYAWNGEAWDALGSATTLADLGVTATAEELNYISGVTSGVQSQLDGKAASVHTHETTDVTGLDTALSGKANAVHTHAVTDVTGLRGELDGKAASKHTHTVSEISDFPESMPASDVYSWAKSETKPTYTATEVGAAEASHIHDDATTSVAGFMSAADKTKLDGIEEGATKLKIDSTLKLEEGRLSVVRPVPDSATYGAYLENTEDGPAWAVFKTATTSQAGLLSPEDKAKIDASQNLVTGARNGLMRMEDKTKLDGIAANATAVTKTSDITNDSDFQTSTQVQAAINTAVSAMYTVKGSTTRAELPESPDIGDVYNLTDEDGMNVVWTGTEWDDLGSQTVVTWEAIQSKPSTFTPSTHTHTVSQITDFPTSMPASDVSAWAKAATKPAYTASEVGAAAADHTHSQYATTDSLESTVSDFTDALNTKLDNPSGGTTGQVLTKTASGEAWQTIDIPDSVTVDSALSDTSENPVQNKVIHDKFETMTSDFADMLGTKADKDALSTKLDAPSGGSTGQVLQKTESGTQWANMQTYSNATTSSAGLMSAADKTKLDGIASNITFASDADFKAYMGIS